MNVLIKKGGTAGYESSPVLIMQGHIDMVCDKNEDTEHDFLTEPLEIYIDGDDIKARGTTLGADNGIAAAYMLALLDAEISHIRHWNVSLPSRKKSVWAVQQILMPLIWKANAF